MARSKNGAPAQNLNAVRSGLYTTKPALLVTVAPDVDLQTLAEYGRDLADVALWIADLLTTIIEELTLKEQKLIGLYSTVGQELHQLAAELAGVTGIKPASLGGLKEKDYELLMTKHAQALSLTLSQCMSTWKYIHDREEIRQELKNSADQTTPVLEMPEGLVIEVSGEKFPNPALDYLAGHMRSAKRMMREMAANQAWKHRDDHSDGDLSAQVMSVTRK